MTDAVLTERRDGVLVITINRPEAKNAVNGAVAAGIAAALDELDASDDLRVGVLTGAGGVFSAGMDLKAFLTGEVPVIEGRGLGGLTEAPPRKPLVAAVEGWALAGGFELAAGLRPGGRRRDGAVRRTRGQARPGRRRRRGGAPAPADPAHHRPRAAAHR